MRNAKRKNLYSDHSSECKQFKFDTKLSVADYLSVVEKIVKANFNNETGDYEPHLGDITTMQLFYNYCVVSSDLDSELPNGIVDLQSIELIANEPCFMLGYNNEINTNARDKLCFGKAYNCAQSMIKEKLNSPNNAIDAVRKAIIEDISQVWKLLTSKEFESLADIVNHEDFDPQWLASAIIRNYANTDKFKEAILKTKGKN